VVIAVVAVRVVQAAFKQVVKVVAVRHAGMAAAIVLAVAGYRGAGVGVSRGDLDDVLVIMVAVRRVQVAVVQVIDVAVVAHAGVPTVVAVDVAVVGVDGMAHGLLLWGMVGYRVIGHVP
jgi:hypothetical protein